MGCARHPGPESPPQSLTILRPAIVFRRAPTVYVGTEGHVLMADVLGASPRAESGLVRRERLLGPHNLPQCCWVPRCHQGKSRWESPAPQLCLGVTPHWQKQQSTPFPSPFSTSEAWCPKDVIKSQRPDQTLEEDKFLKQQTPQLSPSRSHPPLPSRQGRAPGGPSREQTRLEKAVLGNTKASYKPTLGWDLYSFREYERCTH